MTHVDLIKDIQAKKLAPVYLLHGAESYYIDKISEYIENTVVTEEERSFNHSVFYGKDSNVQDILDTCRRFPMFANKQVVTIREANHLKGLENFESYLNHLVPSTILIICYKGGTLDKRKKVYKLLQDKGVVFESTELKENEIPLFIENYLKRKNFSVESKANNLLVDYLGTDLNKITNELDKLIINLQPGAKITVKEIEENIGISKDHNVWELQSALLIKDSSKAFKILHYLNQNPKTNPFVLTISNLHSGFVKLYHFMHGQDAKDWDLFRMYGIHGTQANEYRKAKTLYTKQDVENIFGIFLEYDLRSKGLHNVETPTEQLLREMLYRILN
ncbi:MAG: DNA polymerase III subunit delta [Fimbriimonadaceae bacterium]|nr:DNA polymerase III subunit delta [Chitinophagales bacterium]